MTTIARKFRPRSIVLPFLRWQTARSIGERVLLGVPEGADATQEGAQTNALLAGGTVSCALQAIVDVVPVRIVTTEDLLDANTLCWYVWLGLSAAMREGLQSRIVTGDGHAFHPRLPVWSRPSRYVIKRCWQCDAVNWATKGARAPLCPHQIEFVSVCWKHGLPLLADGRALTPKAVREFRMTSTSEHAFARAAFDVWRMGKDPTRLASHLHVALVQADLVHTNGDYRVGALSQRFSVFCHRHVQDVRLRKLATMPLRARELTHWIAYPDEAIQPAYLSLLWMFLGSEESRS